MLNAHPTHVRMHSKTQGGRGMTTCSGAWLDLGPIGSCSPPATIPLEDPCSFPSPKGPNQQPKSQTDILGESGLSQVRQQKSGPGKPAQPVLMDAKSF